MGKNQASKFYSLMVVGDNPDELIKEYDINKKVEPYIVYRYKDREKLRKNAIKSIQNLLDNSGKIDLNDAIKDYFQEKIFTLKHLSDFEYYSSITDGLSYDSDGNAISTKNHMGKYESCKIGKNMCIPLILKDGSSVFQAHVNDVDWSKIHRANKEQYKVVWELFHKNREPETEQEKEIYENIKNQVNYFKEFSTVDDYINYSSSYWNYAVLNKDGWTDAEDMKNYEWITKFYDKYIKTLSNNELITIYECTK
jgi:hypothetical protein